MESRGETESNSLPQHTRMIKSIPKSASRRLNGGRGGSPSPKAIDARKTLSKRRRQRNGHLDKNVLARIVQRIVEAARPEKIILFGSAARGTMGPNSDADLLVVKRGKFSRWDLAGRIYQHLHGVGAAVDVVIVTPEEIERYRDVPFLVICPALREGRVVYGA
jgi:uncharacterized protein